MILCYELQRGEGAKRGRSILVGLSVNRTSLPYTTLFRCVLPPPELPRITSMSRKSLLVVPTASDERVEASPDQDDDDPVQAVETDDQLDIALRVSTDGQVVSTAPEAPSHDQSTSAANDSGDRDQQTSPQVEPAPDSAVPVAPSKNLGVSLTLGADSKRVKNYRALASSFKYLQPFCRNTDGKYPAKTVCVLCATGKPTSVFFPCQHLCVCNKCIDGNDMSPEFSMDLDRWYATLHLPQSIR